MIRADVAVVGGGVVGTAIAHRLTEERPGTRVVLCDKEDRLATHQSGRNSGVLHSGVYYRPGSLKARLCVAGKALLEAFCEAEGVAWRRTGKVIVATEPDELPRLDALHRRGIANSVPSIPLDPAGLRRHEPHARGLAALWVPSTGIVDVPEAVRRMAHRAEARGARVLLGSPVRGMDRDGRRVVVHAGSHEILADQVVIAAGLHGDRVARAASLPTPERIVPFRGEYWELRASARHLCRTLIYPVPDPAFPFLGVHLTTTLDGGVEAGPNAVLAFAREGYRWGDVSPRDLADTLSFPGFWRLAARHAVAGAAEMRRSLSTAAWVHALQRLVPEITADDLSPAPAGVRAQAVDVDGALVDDFRLHRVGPILYVANAPSPAATASMAIARHVTRRLL